MADWLNDKHVIDVVTPPGVGTDTELQVDLDAAGLGKGWQTGDVEILSRKDASGVYQVLDGSASIDQNGILRIAEGAVGFTAAHVYRILLIAGSILTPTVTST